jgi:hypothetical protein
VLRSTVGLNFTVLNKLTNPFLFSLNYTYHEQQLAEDSNVADCVGRKCGYVLRLQVSVQCASDSYLVL